MRTICGTILAAAMALAAPSANARGILCLTFDDSHFDDWEAVMPLFEKYNARAHVSAYADIETAYWARGAIVDKKPFSAQYADLSFDLDPFGRIGGYAWSVSSLSKSGQSATRRKARVADDAWEFVLPVVKPSIVMPVIEVFLKGLGK